MCVDVYGGPRTTVCRSNVASSWRLQTTPCGHARPAARRAADAQLTPLPSNLALANAPCDLGFNRRPPRWARVRVRVGGFWAKNNPWRG